MVENPCIDLHEDGCKFYVDKLNDQKYGHCLIFSRGGKPIELVKDRNGKRITPAQIEWFNDNCPGYPFVEDASVPLLPECGFSFEVMIDA